VYTAKHAIFGKVGKQDVSDINNSLQGLTKILKNDKNTHKIHSTKKQDYICMVDVHRIATIHFRWNLHHDPWNWWYQV
jgi:hypothetical protein